MFKFLFSKHGRQKILHRMDRGHYKCLLSIFTHNLRTIYNQYSIMVMTIITIIHDYHHYHRCRHGEKPEVLGQYLPQCPIVYHKSHASCPGSDPDLLVDKPATRRRSHCTIFCTLLFIAGLFQPLTLHSRMAITAELVSC
jgi:hypothetical protein